MKKKMKKSATWVKITNGAQIFSEEYKIHVVSISLHNEDLNNPFTCTSEIILKKSALTDVKILLFPCSYWRG